MIFVAREETPLAEGGNISFLPWWPSINMDSNRIFPMNMLRHIFDSEAYGLSHSLHRRSSRGLFVMGVERRLRAVNVDVVLCC